MKLGKSWSHRGELEACNWALHLQGPFLGSVSDSEITVMCFALKRISKLMNFRTDKTWVCPCLWLLLSMKAFNPVWKLNDSSVVWHNTKLQTHSVLFLCPAWVQTGLQSFPVHPGFSYLYSPPFATDSFCSWCLWIRAQGELSKAMVQ
jgi:hypothetical protein